MVHLIGVHGPTAEARTNSGASIKIDTLEGNMSQPGAAGAGALGAWGGSSVTGFWTVDSIAFGFRLGAGVSLF